MAEYVFDPIDSDEEFIEQESHEYLQTQWPLWVPNVANLETWLLARSAQQNAETRDLASDVPPAIFKYFGESLMGVAPVEATSASVDSTWTFTSNPAGRTILAGTTVAIEGNDGDLVAFEVQTDVTVATPALTTPAGAVTLVSVEEGDESDGLGGVGVTVDLIDALSWVDTVTLTGATTGGADEEDIDTYLDRLSARLTLLTPKPVLPEDFAVLAADLAAQNGVTARVMSLDGFNPGDSTYGNERMVTVAVCDQDTGSALAAPVKTAIETGLEAQREVNFIVHVVDPTSNTVNVAFTIEVLRGYVKADVVQEVEDAIAQFLAPQNWGASPGDRTNAWYQTASLWHQDVSTVINNVPGVIRWTVLTTQVGAGPVDATDKVLSGVAPLTAPGTIVGTAV